MNTERNGNIIALVGITGSGKSTFAEHIGKTLNSPVLRETAEGNPFMGDAHKTEGLIFQNQVWFTLKTIERWTQADKLKKTGQTVVMDTFLPTNIIHSKIALDPKSFVLYERLSNQLAKGLPPPKLVIYLFDSAEFIIKRLNQRGLTYDNVDHSYVDKLLTAHEDWLKKSRYNILKIRSRLLENPETEVKYLRAY